jgi:hypothetical protein
MSLRVVIIGLMMVTALALGLIGFQIANPTQPTTTAVVLGVKPDVVIPDLGKRMLEAINLGIPAVRRVREIAGVDASYAGRSWLRRMFGG